MARPLRIEYNGAWYHAMNRGLERRLIFRNDQDRLQFLHLLKDISQLFGVEIHAFSLMDNHYHLLVHTPNAQLGRAMRHLNGLYTQKFNKTHRRDGPLFRGRYKAKLVDDNHYLSELLRYIHRNPVDAKICTDAREHTWTSQRHYLKKIKGYGWLKTKRLLKLFGKDERTATKRLEDFVSQRVSDDILLEIQKSSLNIIGTDGFKEWVDQNMIQDNHKKTKSIPKNQKKLPKKQSPVSIIRTVAFMYNISPYQLRKQKYDNDAKLEAAYFLREILGLPLKKIAKFTNMANDNCVSQVLHRVRQNIKKNRGYAKKMKEKCHYIQSGAG